MLEIGYKFNLNQDVIFRNELIPKGTTATIEDIDSLDEETPYKVCFNSFIYDYWYLSEEEIKELSA